MDLAAAQVPGGEQRVHAGAIRQAVLDQVAEHLVQGKATFR
jgi:hypothetical protein